MNENQDHALRFLKADHGPYVLESPLKGNPIAQELGLVRGDLIATFSKVRFVIWQDGGMSPLPHL